MEFCHFEILEITEFLEYWNLWNFESWNLIIFNIFNYHESYFFLSMRVNANFSFMDFPIITLLKFAKQN